MFVEDYILREAWDRIFGEGTSTEDFGAPQLGGEEEQVEDEPPRNNGIKNNDIKNNDD